VILLVDREMSAHKRLKPLIKLEACSKSLGVCYTHNECHRAGEHFQKFVLYLMDVTTRNVP